MKGRFRAAAATPPLVYKRVAACADVPRPVIGSADGCGRPKWRNLQVIAESAHVDGRDVGAPRLEIGGDDDDRALTSITQSVWRNWVRLLKPYAPRGLILSP